MADDKTGELEAATILGQFGEFRRILLRACKVVENEKPASARAGRAKSFPWEEM